MKERTRSLFRNKPTYVVPGDRLELTEKYPNGTERVVLRDTVDRPMTITEAVTFDVELGEFGAVDGIGGAFLEMEKK